MQFYKIDGHIQDKSKNDNAHNSKEQKELKGDIQSKSMSFNQGFGYKAYFYVSNYCVYESVTIGVIAKEPDERI